MTAIENPAKHQCALFRSSMKHYIHAIEMSMEDKNLHGQLTAAAETAEAGDDMELSGWLETIRDEYEATGNANMGIARLVAIRYNDYNAICDWGLPLFDPDDPFGLPGSGQIDS